MRGEVSVRLSEKLTLTFELRSFPSFPPNHNFLDLRTLGRTLKRCIELIRTTWVVSGSLFSCSKAALLTRPPSSLRRLRQLQPRSSEALLDRMTYSRIQPRTARHLRSRNRPRGVRSSLLRGCRREGREAGGRGLSARMRWRRLWLGGVEVGGIGVGSPRGSEKPRGRERGGRVVSFFGFRSRLVSRSHSL